MADNEVKISVTLDENGVSSGVSNISGEMQNMGAAVDSSSSSIDSMSVAFGNLASQAITAAVSAVKEFAVSVVETGMDFESTMSQVEALSGATGEELEALSDAAKEYGSSTKYSATECASALSYMALAGWDAQQSTEALPGILNLAAASGMDLASASDLVTDNLSAFGMEAEDATYMADLLAYAQANSNTTVEALGAAYTNCASSMTAAGQDIETTTAVLGVLANNGIKGSQAGTILAAVMRDITNNMEDGEIAIGDVNVAVADSDGNFRDLTDILIDVEAAVDGMGDAEKAAALSTTFTANSIKGMNTILNAGTDEVVDFEEALSNCNGTAQEMADIMSNNLEGDVAALESAFDGLKIEVYEDFEPCMRDAVQGVTAVLNGDWDTAFSSAISFAEDLGSGMWDLIDSVFPGAKEGAQQFCEDVGGFFEGVGETIEGAWNTVKTGVSEWWTDITGNLRDWWGGVQESASSFFSGVGETISGAWSSIKSGVSTWWNDITGNLRDWWGGVKESAGSFFGGVGETISGAWETVSSGVSEWWGDITEDVGEWWDGVTTKADEVFTGIGETINGAWESVSGGVSEWWGDITEDLGEWWDGVVETADGIWETVSGGVEEAWETISTGAEEAWDGITTGLSEAWDGIVSVGDQAWEAVTTGVSGAWDTVCGWFGWGSKESEEIYEECLDEIVSDTDNWGVDDAFETKMEETEQEMHRSAGYIEEAYEECCEDIEAMTSGIEVELDDILLPHIEYTLIDVPLIGTIPDPDNLYTNWYKTGAIATGPSVVGIGEAGNEAIVPLSGSMMQPFAEAVAEGISNTGKGDIYITINMDHVNAGRDDIKELAEELSQELGARVRRELARQGVRS